MASDSVTKPRRTIKKKDERERMLDSLRNARWELLELANSNRRAMEKLESNAKVAEREAGWIADLLESVGELVEG